MITRGKCFSFIALQSGFTTLTIALIILFLMTFMALYAARVGVMEQRITANQFWAEKAFTAAEAGVEQGIAYLRRNRGQMDFWIWTSCNDSEIELPCGDGSENIYDGEWQYSKVEHMPQPNDVDSDYELYFLRRTTDPMVFTLVAKGCSVKECFQEDTEVSKGAGHALAKQGLYFFSFRATIPDTPLMASGTITGSGTFDVVTNPNGGGLGVPLSAWADDEVNLGGSARTCHIGEFLMTASGHSYQTDSRENTITLCPQCSCPSSDFLSDGNFENIDILDVDNNYGVNPDTKDFPSDVFQYIFGVPEKDWRIIKHEATVLPDCSSLDTSSQGLYWITGNCSPSSDVGKYSNPVLLVVEGKVTVNSNLQIFALIFVFSSDPIETAEVKLNGGPTVYGAVISNRDIDLGSGTYRMRFDSTVLENLYNSISSRGLGPIPGSWADYHHGDGT